MVSGPIDVSNNNWQFKSYKLSGIELTAGSHQLALGAYQTESGQYIAVDRIVLRKTGEIPYPAARVNFEAEAMIATGGVWTGPTYRTLWNDGLLSAEPAVSESGIYEAEIFMNSYENGNSKLPQFRLLMDGSMVSGPIDVSNNNWQFKSYKLSGIELTAGSHQLALGTYQTESGQYIAVDRLILRKVSPPDAFIIQGGAQYTNSRVLDLDLSTLASHYGVPQLVKYYSGTYVSDWEPFSVHRVLTVEDDGYKAINVYAKFSDISYKMFGSSIIVDTVPPNIAFDPLTTPTVLNKKTLTVNYAVDYTHYREEGTYLHWETKQITFTNLMEGENTLTITETDPAGNQTTVTRKVIVDTSLPDYTWIGGSSENHAWSTQANWINGIIPGAADTVTFYADSADCVIDAAVTLANMTMMAGYNGVITQQADVNISGNYSQAGGQWVDANPTTHAFNVGNSFSIPSAAGAFNRYGDQVFGYYLVRDVYDFQAMSGFLSSNFRLVNHVDASKTVNWNSGAGFDSIGNYDASHPEYAFSGTFDGNGLTINGLTVNRATESYSGLFGRTTNATLRNIGLVGGSITGRNLVGAIAGYMKSSSLENSYSTAAVIGDGQSDSIGGLVGYANASAVTNSYATGNVSNGGMFIGGLVGEIYVSSITNSYATGNVSPGVIGLHMGGLVGGNVYSSITNSFATGNVIGSGGGLVGTNYESSSITNSYATGNVTGWGGGLVGDNYASSFIANSFATGSVSDGGGLIGGDNGGTVSNSYFTDASHNNGLGTYESGGISAFYSVTHPVYNVSGLNPWDFTTVWDSSSNALPLLYQNLQFLYKWDIPQNGQVTESIYTVKNAATILIAKTVYLNGSEMDPSNNKDHWPILSQYTYYSSGNLKSWHESWSSTTYTYENQDYFHMRQGGVGYGVGRVIRIAEQMQNGDTYLRTAEYFSDKLNISRQKKEILRNGQAIPQEDESYYDEDLYPNPAVNVDAAGNKYVSALIPDGAGNWKVRLIQYNAQGVYQWGVNVDASFSGSSAVNAVDPEGNVYLAVTQ